MFELNLEFDLKNKFCSNKTNFTRISLAALFGDAKLIPKQGLSNDKVIKLQT